jgi:DNA-binding transcriptional MerR regulator
MDKRYTLEELVERTGIEARTIRSYIQRGLLRGPEAMGPKAYYVPYHLRRLEAIKLLKDYYGLKLGEVRQILLAHNEEDFDPRSLGLTPVMTSWALPSFRREITTNLVRSVKGQWWNPDLELVRDCSEAILDGHLERAEKRRVPLGQLLELLRDSLKDRPARRVTRGEPWMHMEVTPDITMTARGKYTVEELAILEQIADCMRQILLGGTSDDD